MPQETPHGRSLPGPSVAPENHGHLAGHGTWSLGDVREAVPEHHIAFLRRRVVAPEIPPPRLLGMSGSPVELDAHAVARIANVVIRAAAQPPGSPLAGRLWQAMRPLDVAEIAPLKDRVAALADIVEESSQVAASRDSRASPQGAGEPVARGEPPPACHGDPDHGVIEAACASRQVKHGLFDPPLWWHPSRMPSHVHVGGPVHNHAGQPGDATLGRDRDVNGTAVHVDQTDLRSRGLVGQDRPRPGAEHGGPAQGGSAHLAAERGICAGRQALPATRPDPVANGVGAEARRQRLRTAEHAALAPTDLFEFTSLHSQEPADLGTAPPHPLWTTSDCGQLGAVRTRKVVGAVAPPMFRLSAPLSIPWNHGGLR
jgi:hypothetical protein